MIRWEKKGKVFTYKDMAKAYGLPPVYQREESSYL